MTTCRCGHPESHHDAGECWTDEQGREVWGNSACRCSWFDPAESPNPNHNTESEST